MSLNLWKHFKLQSHRPFELCRFTLMSPDEKNCYAIKKTMTLYGMYRQKKENATYAIFIFQDLQIKAETL